MENTLHYIVKSKIKNVALARNIAQIFFSQVDSSISFLNEIKTIVSEGVTNSIIHGYEENEEMDIKIKLEYDDSFIYIDISDDGVGIEDVELAKTPLYSTKSDSERSGLGFTIMDVFSDSMQVISEKNKGTTLKIVKKII